LPLVLVGREVIANKGWAIMVSLLSGLFMTLIALCFVLGLVSAGSVLWHDIPGFRAMYPLMVLLFLLQSVVSAIAGIAWQAREPR
jgi:hypothetical protein